MALAKEFRLKNKKDIDSVFKKGKTVRNSFFFLKYIPSPVVHGRIAVSVTGKAIPTAYEKNRIKRRVLEVLRTHHFFLKKYDMVVVVQKRPDIGPHSMFVSALEELFKEI
jgi:ribonuclease P protein component